MAKKRKHHSPLKRLQRLPVRLWSWESETEPDGTRSAYGAMQLNGTWRGLTHAQSVSLLGHGSNLTDQLLDLR